MVEIHESPIQKYCEKMDKIYMDYSYMQLYYNVALEQDTIAFTNQFLKEIEWRADHQTNILASIEGEQGCQPKNSKVLMSTGKFKSIDKLKIGDEIISLQYNGNVTFEKIINTCSWFCDEMYSVVSNRTNKLLYKCSFNHLIPLYFDFMLHERGRTKKTEKKSFTQLNILTTPKEIISWQEKIKCCRWQIKQGVFISEFRNNINCEINPYFLGVFLGDGCFRKTMLSISSANKRIIEKISEIEKPMRQYSKPNNKAMDYFFSTKGIFGKQLEKIGLRGSLSDNKFIPKQALYSSSKYRLNLLNGLIDTDGYVDKNGHITLTTKSKQLAKDIHFLTCSLGGNASISKIKKTCQIKDFVGTYYNVSVTLGAYKNLLELNSKFKQDRLFNKTSWQKQGILNFKIKKSKPEQVFGITITGNSQLYITNNMIVTHNTGKSLFTCDLALRTGLIFDYPFNFERDIFTNPFMLEKELRFDNTPRRTYLYDEQPQRRVGIGSISTQISLRDYEDFGRYSQKNIYYCSPEIREHNHYFVFRQVDYDISRIENEICQKCVKYSECHKQFYKTLCDIPFNERDGYPKSFSFLLETKRLSDKMYMPRGIVTLPMLSPKSAESYNRVKKRNLENFSKFQSNYMRDITNELNDFIKKYHDVLIKVNKKGEFVPLSIKQTQFYFYEHFSTERFTNDQVDMFLPIIKDKVGLLCSEKNNNENVLNSSVKGV